MQYLLGLIGLLFGGFMYQRSKRQTAEARNDNLTTKEKLLDIDKNKSKNDGLLEAEDQKQKELKDQLQNVNIESSITSIVDFLNKKK